MITVTVKVPEYLFEQMKRLVELGVFVNISELIRVAIRRRIYELLGVQ